MMAEKKGFADKTAKIVRIASIPPVMVSLLVLALELFKPEVFKNWVDVFFAIFGLAVLPVAAYPLSYLIPKLKEKGREGQRNLAFALSVVGYIVAWLYGYFFSGNRQLQMIFTIYLFSVIILLIFNKLLHLRASGHASSVAGPLVLLCYYLGAVGILAGSGIYALVFWASVYTKRHTAMEFILGTVSVLTAFAAALLIFN